MQIKMSKQFIAKIYSKQKFGDLELLQEVATLTKSALLPDSTFVFEKRSYTIDLAKSSWLNSQRIPVVCYEKNQAIPMVLDFKEIQVTASGIKPDSEVFDKLFRRGMMSAILSAATKAKESASPYIYIALGIFAGVVIGWITKTYLH